MKNKKLIGSLVVMAFIMLALSPIGNPRNLNNSPELSQGTIYDDLIPINFSINIGDNYPGDNYPNWSYYVDNYDWCSGNGTEKDPYIIEGIHVTNENMTAHISIETAEHFIIRNVTVSNYAKPYGHHIYAGIYIGKGEFGLIDNVTIINSSHGISLAEAKGSIKITNNKFIGSHDDPKTGLGAAILIHEAKGVNISYNYINNYYSGIVVYDAEDIYVEHNTIQTNFGYISDTGIYFYNVNNSEITYNDLYGCSFTGHEYEVIVSSGIEGLAISNDLLTDCFNITIYGNRFYDLDGNLIVPDEPDEPELSSTMPNYWIFIISGIAIVAVIIVVAVVLIKKKSK